MFEYIKQRIVKNLIEEIECLSPTNLELVGNNLVSIIEEQKMIHHGINKDYKPAGYTVDSFSNNSKIIAEYSTEKNYFEDSSKKDETVAVYKKIEKDIEHAYSHNDSNKLDKIYLIASHEEPPSFRKKFNKTPIGKRHGAITTIFDSRELAKLIYEQSIKFPDYASYYKPFFPGFSQNLDNYEYYGRIPSFCDKHISDYHAIEKVKHHLSNNDICVISGISGSGKTQLTIDYIHNEKNNFENYLWISGDDWKKNTSLSSIQRTRGGSPVNIAGLFNSSKTILVIDNLNRILNDNDTLELSHGFSIGSKLIVTSQISRTNKIYLSIPEFSDDVSLQILGEIPSRESQICKNVVKLCNCSPLILSTIRNLVDEEGIERNELYNEVLKYPNDIHDNNGKSIMSGILGKLEPNSLNALKKIANSGSPIHDSEFLGQYIKVLNRTNLQRISILLPANIPNCLKIHDLVYTAVQDNLNSKDISKGIENYIAKHNASMSPSLIRQIHLSYKMLLREYHSRDKNKPDWITYSLLQIEEGIRDEIQESLHNKTIVEDMDLSSIKCLVDSKEAHAYSIENKDSRNTYFKDCINEYENIIHKISNDEIKIEILHHLGKAYRRTGLAQEALDNFLELLKIDSNMHASYLQIVHLGSQYEVDEKFKKIGAEYLEKLLVSITEDYTTVPLRVSLGTFARLRSYKEISKRVNQNKERVKKLANIIVVSSFEGFGQFFEAFVSFTSVFNYHNSLECLNLIKTIPELLTTTPEVVDKNNWLNACEGLTNIALSALREEDDDLSQKIADTSILFANKIFEKTKLSAYEGRALAKAYSTANLYEKALLSIDKVPIQSQDHWLLYQKSKVQLKNKDSNCYSSATNAFELAKKDNYAKSRLSIYHDLLSQCAELYGTKEEAKNQAKFALDKCTDNKYKVNLENRFKELSNQ
ncbi:tetratricopeptide repeat protein [Winogradskyella costae]|uniref:tetratricopeptide repeat protein n=1 Tax=Winogradskyella costae TaxID=2697008 RepID=UPI0015CAD650|nr:tetratricopeptide repeat protein [Winogradskyella costae]